MKLEPSHDAAIKRCWKIVRTDNYADIPGEIVAADEDTGECSMRIKDETKTLNLGPGGFKLIRK